MQRNQIPYLNRRLKLLRLEIRVIEARLKELSSSPAVKHAVRRAAEILIVSAALFAARDAVMHLWDTDHPWGL
jgi:hypothetical protein